MTRTGIGGWPVLILALVLLACGCGGDEDDDAAPDDDVADDAGDDDAGDDTGDDDTAPPAPRDDGSFVDDATPFERGYETRKAAYLEACADEGAERGGRYAQVCVASLCPGPVREADITAVLDKMDARQDTADFGLQAIVRILVKYADSPCLDPDLRARMEESVLRFKYWIDEPGADGMCYWSENHQMLFNAAGFILGGLYADRAFTNSGVTGSVIRERARPRIVAWLDRRLAWGFSEFHSNVYYNEDVPPLVNLADFAGDPEVSVKAMMVLDLLFLDMALNNHEGVLGVPHGRSYKKDKLSGRSEDTAAMIGLAFGKGEPPDDFGNFSAAMLVTSDAYRLPAVIESIGSARPRGLESRERLGIRIEDGPARGLPYDDFAAGIFYWGMGAYPVPEVIDTTLRMADAYDLWAGDGFFAPFEIAMPLVGTGLLPLLSEQLSPITRGSALTEVSTYVYRTPETMLASAQDWKKATLGFQSHAWQATLGTDALVFTTAPGPFPEDMEMATAWTGGWHPRIGQHRTAAIVLYEPADFPADVVEGILGVVFPKVTHAYFPLDAFDETVTVANWTIARKGDGYVALYSLAPTTWRREGEFADREVIADGAANVWIVEVGDAALYGSFDDFVAAIRAARVEVKNGPDVLYQSPGQGEMRFSWDGPLLVRGNPVDLGPYRRHQDPWVVREFDGDEPYVVERAGLRLTLDPATLTREVEE
jgi:hypothetical protein